MKRRGSIVLALAVLVAAALAATAVASSGRSGGATSSQAFRCNSAMKIAFVTPLTGGAGFIGNEQLTWAKYAVKTLPRKMGLKVQLVTGDTPVEQGPAPAQTLAQKFIADQKVVAILGPSTSGAVAASSKLYGDARMAHVSPSATRTSLTKGSNIEATEAFFRIVPGDYIQGPSDARFIADKLKAKKVVVLDFQEPYSLGLADVVERGLKAKNVATTRLSVPNTVSDFSSFVTRVPNDADIVFFPTQKPADAQTFAQQLLEQGKKAKVFGGDGANGVGVFKAPGSYFSNFAPDISGIARNKALVAGWKKDNPKAQLGSFGPPAYGAVEVILTAIKNACTSGKGTIKNRAAVLAKVKSVRIKNWLLGGSFRFSTKSNDPLNGTFYIFQIQSDGSYKLVS